MFKLLTMTILLYIQLGVMVIFNFIMFATGFIQPWQLVIPGLWVIGIFILIINIPTKRSLIWWGTLVVSLVGILRPALGFLFNRYVPHLGNVLFPSYTAPFAVVGFVAMTLLLIICLDPRIKNQFDKE